jgi:hypothetical protein
MASGKWWRRAAGAGLLVVGITGWTAAPAWAQSSPNGGAITLTGSLDAGSAYFRRGIPQDDTGLILWPAIEGGVALSDALTVRVGSWNSLHTGDRGLDGPTGRLWYASEFYGSVTFATGGTSVGASYTAFTSPNGAFASVQEVAVTVSRGGRYRPYALLSQEIRGQLDAGLEKGRYLELGAAPTFGSRLTLAFPVKAGFSLGHYYEGLTGDERFGFLSVGARASRSLTQASKYGRWNVHGGVEYVMLGDRNELQFGSASTVIGSAGIGFSY